MSVTMIRNQEHNGIELYFSEKPSQEILQQLKQDHHFRWSSKKKMWFAKETAERLAFAKQLAGEDSLVTDSKYVYRMHSNPRSTGDHNRYFIQVYEKQDDQLFPGRIPFIGTEEECGKNLQKLTKGSINSQQLYEQWQKKAAKEQSTPAAGHTQEKPPNTFAAYYDEIGSAKILSDSDHNLLTYVSAFFQEDNFSYRRTYGDDSITIQELNHAGQTGQTCRRWCLYPDTYGASLSCILHNDNDIRTCGQLFQALHDGKELTGVRISQYDDKAIEVFSPFVEYKPLKSIPNKWTKRNFTQALVSGQIYQGQIDQRLTDDYAMDAAYNFSEGCPINIPVAAMKSVEGWSSGSSVRQAGEPKGDVVQLSFYDYSTSKTFWFDLNCNIQEAKRRTEDRAAGLKQYNKMMENSCIQVDPQQLDPDKIYQVTTLSMNGNTGRYGTDTKAYQGYNLIGRLDPEESCLPDQLLDVQEMEIEPDALYSVADFFRRREHAEDDPRIINCGNYRQIVTGKALLELTGEQVYFPAIHKATGEFATYESALETLSSMASGKSFFMFSKNENYNQSVERLVSEYSRASTRSLDDMIKGASQRASAAPASEKAVPDRASR